ncbi:hypothetical protein pEp_SNUABM10_00046 [Erwinia phage pEp_SNUABM_10]|nr:hypothetical protein pEp_SNUABM03_00043 [Erwinia phage pEp_SNUABM_03]QOC57750.1 hypothetical protein pEp_SNUABM10_00046 [Erwinia phage pEp_SNUABM_10]
MLIFEQGDWRVIQHPYLQIFHILKWSEGDDPRSYGRTWDYFTQKECRSIEEVKEYLRANMA